MRYQETRNGVLPAFARIKSALGPVFLKAFCLLFCYSFLCVAGGVIFSREYGLAPPLLLLLIPLALFLLLFIYRALENRAQWVGRRYPLIVGGGLLLLFAVNLAAGYLLRYEPIYDLDAIFTGARDWVETGSFTEYGSSTAKTDYFYYFPNNLGGMALLYVVFKIASLFGAVDYFAAAMLANLLLAAGAVLLAVLVCKRLLGTVQSVMALLCVLLSPPFWFIAPVFYTDSLSMIFPVLVFYLYLKGHDAATVRGKILFTALAGLCGAAGMLIKFTVVIALIAAAVFHLWTKGLRAALLTAAVPALAAVLVFAGFNAYIYSHHLDKAKADNLRVPYSHWIMMSLEGNGRYNPGDYEFTFSFEDKEEQKEAIAGRIGERIQKMGAAGLLRLFYSKGAVVFGDPTYAHSDFLDDNPVNETALHAFLLYGGKQYSLYQHVCAGVYFALQALILVPAYGLLRRGRPDGTLLLLICLFGVLLFFMLWEVSGRYAVNYIPVIIITAVAGLDRLANTLREKGLPPGGPARPEPEGGTRAL